MSTILATILGVFVGNAIFWVFIILFKKDDKK